MDGPELVFFVISLALFILALSFAAGYNRGAA